MASWYIHVHDPTFFEPPWPGQRRLGPFTSAKQALEQAASDFSYGMGEGIIAAYTGTTSDRMRTEDFPDALLAKQPSSVLATTRAHVVALTEDFPEAVSLKEIQARADELAQARIDEQATRGMDEIRDDIRKSLPAALRDDEQLITAVMKATRLIG